MADIVTRLRDRAYSFKAVDTLCEEAASEIERLRWKAKTSESAAKYADTMQRSRAGQKVAESDSSRAVCPERDSTNHDAAPAARASESPCAGHAGTGGTKVGVSATGAESGSTPDAQGFGRSNEYPCQPFDSAPTTDQERFVRFQSSVMNWISEATGFLHDDVLRTDDARDVITNACSRCWDAFDRISYPTTNHDAAPAARATADRYVRRAAADGDSNRTDKADSRPSEGTGKQPAPPCVETDGFSHGSDNGVMRAVSERESPRREFGESSLRDVARPDTKGKVAGGPEPLLSSGGADRPVSYAKGDEKRGDPTTKRCATQPRNGALGEPVAWVAWFDDEDRPDADFLFSTKERADDWCCKRGADPVPLYRHPQPTLTDAEREAVEVAIAYMAPVGDYDSRVSHRLRCLLGRLGGLE